MDVQAKSCGVLGLTASQACGDVPIKAMSRRHGASKRRLRLTARPTARCKQSQRKVKSAGAGARAGGGAENAHDGGRAGCGAYYGQGGALVAGLRSGVKDMGEAPPKHYRPQLTWQRAANCRTIFSFPPHLLADR